VTEDRPWLGEEPTARPDPTLKPIPSGLAAFTAIATPFVIYGVSRDHGGGHWVLIGVLVAAIVGLVVIAVIDRYGGHPPFRSKL
jgi:hypothetical protein